MKKGRVSCLLSYCMTVLQAALIGVAIVLCFSESFGLDCPLELTAGICSVTAMIAAGLGLFRNRLVFPVAGSVLCLFGVWQRAKLQEGLLAVLLPVTTRLARDFPIPVIGNRQGEMLWFLLPLGVLVTWITAWVYSRKGSALPVLLVCTPVLVCCLLMVDIAPDFWLVILTGGLALLLVTQNVRRRDPVQGNLLAWRMLLPLTLVVLLPVLLTPPKDYVRSAWARDLRIKAETLLGITDTSAPAASPVSSQWNRQLKTVDLSKVGPKSRSKTPVLEYRADTYLTHLRGVSLGVYNNNSWTAADPYEYAAEGFSVSPQITGSGASRTLNIYTKNREKLLYTTYFLKSIPDGAVAVDDAYLENTQSVTEYAISYSQTAQAPTEIYSTYVYQVYTQIPEALQESLSLYVKRNGLINCTPVQIANHVRDSAVYDLKTPRTPSGEDFALYFLEESHRGYCVHFATATTLLLRSQGIPARYVTGYAVDGDIGRRNTVTADQSHAWVEYFDARLGWQMLDPTPADWQEEEDDTPVEELPETPEAPQEPLQPETEPEPETQPEEVTPEPELNPEPDPEPKVSEQEEILLPPSDAENGLPSQATPNIPRKTLTIPKPLLYWLTGIITAVLLLYGQRHLRLQLRKRRCSSGPVNQQALVRWRYLSALCRAAGTTPEAEAYAIAQKARFSCHDVTAEELAVLKQTATVSLEQLRHQSAAMQFWYRYVRALY